MMVATVSKEEDLGSIVILRYVMIDACSQKFVSGANNLLSPGVPL